MHKCTWIGLEWETADLLYNTAAWLPSWAAASFRTRHDLASFENWKSVALDLNRGRTKPCPESFIRYVSYVRASIMQQGEKWKPVRHRTGALKDILLFVLQLCHSNRD